MFKDLAWLFAALLIALVPTLLVLGWLFARHYRDLVARIFVGRAVELLPSYRMPFAFGAMVICWMVGMLFLSTSAWAADAAPAAFVVDWSPLINEVIKLAALAVAAVLTIAAHRAAKTFRDMHVANITDNHLADIDLLIDRGANWAAQQIEAIADPNAKVQVKSALLAKAAQMVIEQAPLQMAAIGMTPSGIKGAIEMRLDPPDPVVAAPAEPSAASAS